MAAAQAVAAGRIIPRHRGVRGKRAGKVDTRGAGDGNGNAVHEVAASDSRGHRAIFAIPRGIRNTADRSFRRWCLLEPGVMLLRRGGARHRAEGSVDDPKAVRRLLH